METHVILSFLFVMIANRSTKVLPQNSENSFCLNKTVYF